MAYRSKGSDDSSSASDSDDDSYVAWKRKKFQNVSGSPAPMEGEFMNPLIENRGQGSSTKVPSYMRFRKNNIWGNVIQEQALTNVISKVDVVGQDAEKVERDVESYHYNKNAALLERDSIVRDHEEMASDKEDDDYFKASIKDRLGEIPADGNDKGLPLKDRLGQKIGEIDNDSGDEQEMECDRRRRHRSHKSRKRTLRDRFGPHGYKRDPLGPDFTPPKMYTIKEKVPVSSADSKEALVNALVENLREPKVDLLGRVVDAIGKQKTVDLFNETETIEENGGLLINNNTRRRTPGGVFFYLLRSDKSIDEEVRNNIFKEDKKKVQNERKERQKQFENLLPQFRYNTPKKGPPGRSKSLDSSSENKEKPKSSSHSASSSPTTHTLDNSPEQVTMETVDEADSELSDAEAGEVEDGEILDED